LSTKIAYIPQPQKKKSRIKKGWIYLAVLLILLFLIKGIWSISSKAVKTVNLELKVISTEFPAEVIFIRDEMLIRSPNKGHISFEDLSEGERVRVNQHVATLTTQTFQGNLKHTPITTSNAGVLSFYTDGFEEVFKGKQIGELDLLELKKKDFGQYREYKNEGELVEEGAPVLKIINPFSDVNFILYFPQEYVIKHGFELLELKDMPLILKNDRNEYRISTTNMGLSGKDVFCFGRVLDRKEDFYNIRKERFTLVLDRQEGYLVSKQAIVYIEDEPGVFIQTHASYDWVSVDILRNLSDKALIMLEDPGYPVVINPQVL